MPGGRPSKLNAERADRFLTAIRTGNYIEVAATYAGIGTSTVYRWLAMGREAKRGEYREFWEKVKAAEATSESAMVQRVVLAGQDPRHWTAAMTFLERRFRDRWGRPAPGSALDGAPEPADAVPGAAVTDDPIVIPMEDRLAGILRTLDRVGLYPPKEADDVTGSNGRPAGDGSAPGHG